MRGNCHWRELCSRQTMIVARRRLGECEHGALIREEQSDIAAPGEKFGARISLPAIYFKAQRQRGMGMQSSDSGA